MDANTYEVSKCLAWISYYFLSLWRSRAKYSRNINRGILKDCVGCSNRAKITARACEWHPRCWSDLPVLVDHLRCSVRSAASWVKERRSPIGEGNACAGSAIRFEIAEAIRDRLSHSIR